MRERMETLRREMDAQLPEDMDYEGMDTLKLELRERLQRLRPNSLAAAAK